MNSTPYGFRVVGGVFGARQPVDAAAALRAYAACDPRAELHREAYLSAFLFGREFRTHLTDTGSVRGYRGPCGLSFLWWDIDRAGDLDAALGDTRRLTAAVLDRYRDLDDDDVLTFFSGCKGAHVGLPAVWSPAPSSELPAITRRFAEEWATRTGVRIDAAVYDPVRLFRAPNSRHPKTQLHKRRLSFPELMGLAADRVADLARYPAPFDLPSPQPCATAAADWREAAQAVAQAKAARITRRPADVPHRLQRETLAFLRGGAEDGERHVRLFRAAANLAEFGCPPALAHALLTEAALDCGLPPAEVRRQIECGLAHVARGVPS